MDSLPIVVGNTHKEKNEAKQMKMKSLYIKVITDLNNLHLCLIFPPKTMRNKNLKSQNKSKVKKRLEKKKKTKTPNPQLHIPRENLTAG